MKYSRCSLGKQFPFIYVLVMLMYRYSKAIVPSILQSFTVFEHINVYPHLTRIGNVVC
jgi:hypothetical protein